jgi:hypothetical protein
MPRLSEKYLAGFLDADGCISLQWPSGKLSPQLRMQFSQRSNRDDVLYRIQETFGGTLDRVTINNGIYTRLTSCGKNAKMVLNRILKYLVIKRHYAGVALEMSNKKSENVEADKLLLKQHRKIKSLPLPNFPSRKWMAGYIDGDGCFYTTRIFEHGAVSLVFKLCSSDYDSEGIELIQKAFGGNIYPMRSSINPVIQYALPLPPSKAIQFISHFGKYCIVKKRQVDFILECARIGHYRDGKRIKEHLKILKDTQAQTEWIGGPPRFDATVENPNLN